MFPAPLEVGRELSDMFVMYSYDNLEFPAPREVDR